MLHINRIPKYSALLLVLRQIRYSVVDATDHSTWDLEFPLYRSEFEKFHHAFLIVNTRNDIPQGQTN
jgi:hypothetical protein